MARPNQPREVFAEQHIAERIRRAREQHGWSLEGLAKRMTDVGCAIQSSAIYKIEKANRRITVDELVALSRVLEMPMAVLVTDPVVSAGVQADALVREFRQNLGEYRSAVRELTETLAATRSSLRAIVTELRDLTGDSPVVEELFLEMNSDEWAQLGDVFPPARARKRK